MKLDVLEPLDVFKISWSITVSQLLLKTILVKLESKSFVETGVDKSIIGKTWVGGKQNLE